MAGKNMKKHMKNKLDDSMHKDHKMHMKDKLDDSMHKDHKMHMKDKLDDGMHKHHHMGKVEGVLMGMGKHMGKKEGVADELRHGDHRNNPAKYNRSLGHNVVTSLTTQTTTTLTVNTTPHNASSTDFLCVVAYMGYQGDSTGAVTCADSLGNTYTQAALVTFNTGYIIALFYAAGIHSMAKNAIITVTHPGATRRIIMGDEFKNIEKTSAADEVAAGHNSVAATFATSGMTAITAQDKELVYGVIGVNGPSIDTFKKPANWTLLHDRGTNASDGQDIRLITQFRLVHKMGTYEVSGTLGTARLWGSITQTFRAEGGSSDRTKD